MARLGRRAAPFRAALDNSSYDYQPAKRRLLNQMQRFRRRRRPASTGDTSRDGLNWPIRFPSDRDLTARPAASTDRRVASDATLALLANIRVRTPRGAQKCLRR